MSRRSQRRQHPLDGLGGYRNFPIHGPPPPDFCMSCGRANSTRGIVALGDPEWMVGITATMFDRHDDMAQKFVEAFWPLIPDLEVLPDDKKMIFRLCRACARDAIERFAKQGIEVQHYNYTRLMDEEYDHPKMIMQESVQKLVDETIDEIFTSKEFQTQLAEDGLTLCRTWDEETQDWSFYVTANEELIAKERYPQLSDNQQEES